MFQNRQITQFSKHLAISLLVVASFCVQFSPPVKAEVVTKLNAIDLEVTDRKQSTRNKAIIDGFKKILLRYSGSSPEDLNSALADLSYRSASFIQRYFYKQELIEAEQVGDEPQEKLLLSLVFDEVAVLDFLNRAGLPQWGQNRPKILVWLVMGDTQQQFFLDEQHIANLQNLVQRSEDAQVDSLLSEIKAEIETDSKQSGDKQNENTLLQQQATYLKYIGSEETLNQELVDFAQLRGVPIMFPLMDLEDRFAISTTDIWSQFVMPIRTASERYQFDIALAGRLELTPDGWQANWLLIDKIASEVWQSEATQLVTELQSGLQTAINQLSKRFAVVQDKQSDETTLISVRNIRTIEDLASMQRFFNDLNSISATQIIRVQNDEVILRISLQAALNNVLQAIRLSRELSEVNPQDVLTEMRENNELQHFMMQRPTTYLEWRGKP